MFRMCVKKSKNLLLVRQSPRGLCKTHPTVGVALPLLQRRTGSAWAQLKEEGKSMRSSLVIARAAGPWQSMWMSGALQGWTTYSFVNGAT
jgi:hypothetical protein